jgi:hypothetical protein
MYRGNVTWIVSRDFFTGLFQTLPVLIVLGILFMGNVKSRQYQETSALSPSSLSILPTSISFDIIYSYIINVKGTEPFDFIPALKGI